MEYDIVAVGHSLSVLVTSAILAKNGKKTLYIPMESQEQEERKLWNQYECLRHHFDIQGGVFQSLLEELDISSLEFDTPPYHYQIQIGDFVRNVPTKWKDYFEVLVETFPEEEDQLFEFFELVRNVAIEWEHMITSPKRMGFREMQNIIRLKDVRYVEYIQTKFKTALLQDTLCIDVPYSEISFVAMAGYLMQIVHSSRIKGGYNKLKNVFTVIIKENGGEIWQEKSLEIDMVKRRIVEKRLQDTLDVKSSIWLVDYDKSTYHDTFMVDAEFNSELQNRCSNVIVFLQCKYERQMDEMVSCIKFSPHGKIVSQLRDIEQGNTIEEYPFTLYTLGEKQEDKTYEYVMVIPVNQNSNSALVTRIVRESILRIEEKFKSQKLHITKRRIFNQLEIQESLHLYRGIQSHWAYSPEEMKKNPVNKMGVYEDLYMLGDWGEAFIPCSINVSRRILGNGLIDGKEQ
nr:hypothetical protein [uncultured Anaerosporobacter sp.]